MGSYFDSTNLTAEEHGNIMRFRQKRPDGTSLVCDVDRRTLTPRLYFLVDPQDKTQFTLRLDQYAMTRNGEKEVPWPRRIVALSSSGRIEVELREVDLNADLPAGAFAPPRRGRN
jgi:hypothetical protein